MFGQVFFHWSNFIIHHSSGPQAWTKQKRHVLQQNLFSVETLSSKHGHQNWREPTLWKIFHSKCIIHHSSGRLSFNKTENTCSTTTFVSVFRHNPPNMAKSSAAKCLDKIFHYSKQCEVSVLWHDLSQCFCSQTTCQVQAFRGKTVQVWCV